MTNEGKYEPQLGQGIRWIEGSTTRHTEIHMDVTEMEGEEGRSSVKPYLKHWSWLAFWTWQRVVQFLLASEHKRLTNAGWRGEGIVTPMHRSWRPLNPTGWCWELRARPCSQELVPSSLPVSTWAWAMVALKALATVWLVSTVRTGVSSEAGHGNEPGEDAGIPSDQLKLIYSEWV